MRFQGIGARYGYIRFTGVALRLPKELQNQLAKLPGELAHPSNERLTRTLQINGAKPAILEAVKHMHCAICEPVSAPRSAPQASAQCPERFNAQVSSDSFFFWDCSGKRWNCTHIVDGFCTLHYGILSNTPNSQCSCELLFDRWIPVHGPMEQAVVDGGPSSVGASKPCVCCMTFVWKCCQHQPNRSRSC